MASVSGPEATSPRPARDHWSAFHWPSPRPVTALPSTTSRMAGKLPYRHSRTGDGTNRPQLLKSKNPPPPLAGSRKSTPNAPDGTASSAASSRTGADKGNTARPVGAAVGPGVVLVAVGVVPGR